jgi:DNA-binding CsgD family transcriptional regulator
MRSGVRAQRRAVVRASYLAGRSSALIAADLGVTARYVNALLREAADLGELSARELAEGKRRRAAVRASAEHGRLERAAQRYLHGEAPETIARELGCSPTTLRAYLAKARRLGLVDGRRRRRAVLERRRREIFERYAPIFRQTGAHPPSRTFPETLLRAVYRYFFSLLRFRVAFDARASLTHT